MWPPECGRPHRAAPTVTCNSSQKFDISVYLIYNFSIPLSGCNLENQIQTKDGDENCQGLFISRGMVFAVMDAILKGKESGNLSDSHVQEHIPIRAWPGLFFPADLRTSLGK